MNPLPVCDTHRLRKRDSGGARFPLLRTRVRITGLSGQHLVGGSHRIGRAFADHTSPAGARWARRIALVAAATLFAPETASAQSFWNWGASDYDQRPVKPKRAPIKRKDPAGSGRQERSQAPRTTGDCRFGRKTTGQDLRHQRPVRGGAGFHRHQVAPDALRCVRASFKRTAITFPIFIMPRCLTCSASPGRASRCIREALPGYAASHGCIRLPNEFAARLWTWTKMGTRVIVAPGEVAPVNFSHAKLVTRMAPLPTVSAAPAPVVIAAEGVPSRSDRMAMAQHRTADARETIEGMRGTRLGRGPVHAARDRTQGHLGRAPACRYRSAAIGRATFPGDTEGRDRSVAIGSAEATTDGGGENSRRGTATSTPRQKAQVHAEHR